MLEKLIGLFDYIESSISENFNEVKILLKGETYLDLDIYRLEEAIADLNLRDKLQISVLIGDNEPIDYYTPDHVQNFVFELNKRMGVREDEPIEIIVTITKKQVNGLLSIYNYSYFLIFLEKQELWNLLTQFNNYLAPTGFLMFENQNQGTVFNTNSIYVVNKEDTIVLKPVDRSKIISKARTVAYSNFFTEFELLPEDFILRSNVKNHFANLLERLAIVAAQAYLFDNFTIEGSLIRYKLNGYKTIIGSINFAEIKNDVDHQLESIYTWTYNSGSFNDKLGLAKNIISLHINPDSGLAVDGSPFNALASAYKVYEKENIKQYIAVRNSLSEQLLKFHDRANTMAESFASSLQKSGLALISFYISVIVLKVVSKDHTTNVFTFDTSIFASVIIICSFFYFWFSRWELINQKKRFSGQYFDLKRRNRDLLDTQDLDRILNYDREFSQDIEFINAKLKRYSFMWLLFLTCMFSSTWLLFFWYK